MITIYADIGISILCDKNTVFEIREHPQLFNVQSLTESIISPKQTKYMPKKDKDLSRCIHHKELKLQLPYAYCSTSIFLLTPVTGNSKILIITHDSWQLVNLLSLHSFSYQKHSNTHTHTLTFFNKYYSYKKNFYL